MHTTNLANEIWHSTERLRGLGVDVEGTPSTRDKELEALVERLSILKQSGWIEETDLPPELRKAPEAPTVTVPQLPPTGLSFRDLVDDFETDLILQALDQTHWNKNQAARLLGLNRTTLIEKIKKKGLAPTAPASH